MSVQDQDPQPELSEKLHTKCILRFILSSVVCSLLMQKAMVPELILSPSPQESLLTLLGLPLLSCPGWHYHLLGGAGIEVIPSLCLCCWPSLERTGKAERVREQITMKLMKVLRNNYLWRNLCPGEIMWEKWEWLGHQIWSGGEGPGFCGNVMETLFPSCLLRSLLWVFSSNVFHVSLAKEADISGNINITTKI